MEKKEIIKKEMYEMNQITQNNQIKGECLPNQQNFITKSLAIGEGQKEKREKQ